MTWAEHLAWCKERALAYVDLGDLGSAVASMASDIQKHDETKMNAVMLNTLTMVGMISVVNCDSRGVREWIEGFR